MLCLLQRWNGMVSALIYQMLRIRPQLLDAQVARRRIGLIVPRAVRKKDAKSLILKYVQSKCDVPLLCEKKKTGTPKDYCYDMADAYVIAKAAHVEFSKSPSGAR